MDLGVSESQITERLFTEMKVVNRLRASRESLAGHRRLRELAKGHWALTAGLEIGSPAPDQGFH